MVNPIHKVLLRRLWMREWLRLLIFCVSLLLYWLLIVALYPNFSDMQIGMMMEQLPPFLINLFGGADLDFDSISGWIVIGVNHPLVIFAFSAMVVTIATRAVAGEISDRTSDVLFATPIRRSQVLWTNVLFLAFGSLLLSLSFFAGIAGGALFLDTDLSSLAVFLTSLNAGLLYFTFGTLTILISLFVRRAGLTMGLASGIIALMFFLDFIAEFWELIAFSAPLYLFHYFDVEAVLLGQPGQLVNVLILLSVSIVALAISHLRIGRIDL